MGSALERPTCRRCHRIDMVIMAAQKTQSGVIQYAWYCKREGCEEWAQKPVIWIPHEALAARVKAQGASMSDIRIVRDYSHNLPCAVWGCSQPAEYHHWWPEAMQQEFRSEASGYPQTPLCRYHHMLWHGIVTPGLVKEADELVARLRREHGAQENINAAVEKATHEDHREPGLSRDAGRLCPPGVGAAAPWR